MDLLNPVSDYVFRSIFSANTGALLSFLNAILRGNPSLEAVYIHETDVYFSTDEISPFFLEIKAQTPDKSSVYIIVQCNSDSNISGRGSFHHSYISPCRFGFYERMSGPVIFIWITDHDETNRKSYLSEGRFMFEGNDEDPAEVTNGGIRLIILELSKVDILTDIQSDSLASWASFLKSPSSFDPELVEARAIRSAMDELMRLSNDHEFCSSYISKKCNAIKDDHNVCLSDVEAVPYVVSEKGRRAMKHMPKTKSTDVRYIAAIKAWECGLDKQKISGITGLSIQEINEILAGK